MFDDFDDTLRDDDEDDFIEAQAEPRDPLLPARENPELLGREEIERQILGWIADGRLPHALIFAGPEGTGKATMAFRLARFLLAEKEPEPEGLFGPPPEPVALTSLSIPIDDPVFRQVASGGHPDLLTIERPYDEKKSRHKDAIDIESARRIAPFMRMTASRDGGWRVVVVDDADAMNRNAQNAILKILEEPPKRALLILIAHRAGALIPTIRSRCRTVTFGLLPANIFTDLVARDNPALSDTDRQTLYALSEGSIGRARDLAELDGVGALGKLLSLVATWPNWKWVDIHALADRLGRQGQEDAYDVHAAIIRWIAHQVVRARSGAFPLPQVLDRGGLGPLMAHYSLADWVEICEKMDAHLDAVRHANLDRRQGIIGAFSIFGRKEAA